MASGPSVSANLEEALRLIELAVSQEAKLVVLPEYFCIMGLQDTDKLSVREQPGEGVVQSFLSETAKRLGVWLVGGSVPLESPTCLIRFIIAAWFMIDDGRQVARYDKIHLFGLALGE